MNKPTDYSDDVKFGLSDPKPITYSVPKSDEDFKSNFSDFSRYLEDMPQQSSQDRIDAHFEGYIFPTQAEIDAEIAKSVFKDAEPRREPREVRRTTECSTRMRTAAPRPHLSS